MDRRREPRIRAYQTVQLTVLGDAGYSTPANATQLSLHGIRLILDRPIPVNAAVKVVCDDWLGLGDVCYCTFERAHYVVGVRLEQVLIGLEELASHNRDSYQEQDSPVLDEAEQLLT